MLGAADTANATVAQVVGATVELQQNSGSTSLVGMTIDGFTIDSILGGGAFGTVYLGHQTGLDRTVAFKVPTVEMAGDPIGARRFAREARSAARVDHPGVVTIYAVGELFDGRPYLAMQYVDGQPLDKILASGPIDAIRALKIVRQIASALSETHAVAVVHRDLKPSNIVWRRDRNGDDRITLVDFGIAVCKPGNADATRLTGANLVGTPHYMSPEQAQGDEVDGRADLYAVGCILFELVTGAPPYEGAGFEVLLAHINKPTPRPSEKQPGVPPEIDVIVDFLMGKKPDDRPKSADVVVALIDAAIVALERSSPTPIPRSSPPTAILAPARRRWWIAALAGGALLAGGFAIATLTMRPPPRVASDPTPVDDEDPTAPKTREIVSDDGAFVCRVEVPLAIHPRVAMRSRIRILTKLGQPIDAADLVVTVEDPKGAATGFTARRRAAADNLPSYFAFRHAFAERGHYIIRIFPPESDSVFRVELDVE